MDPLAEDFASWSPYNYATDNPILFVDPNGESIIIYGEVDGKNTKVEYQPGQTAPEGASEFITNTITSLNYIFENGGGDIIQELVDFENAHVNIQETKEFGEARFSPISTTGGTLNFNPQQGNDHGENGQKSPAVILAHELDHAHKNNALTEKAIKKGNFKKLLKFQSGNEKAQLKEEQRATKGLERTIANSLGQYGRKDYRELPQRFYVTEGPLSIAEKRRIPADVRARLAKANRALEQARARRN